MCKCSAGNRNRNLSDEDYNATQRDPWRVPAALAGKLGLRQDEPTEQPAGAKSSTATAERDPWRRYRAGG